MQAVRSKVSKPDLVRRRCDRLGDVAAMRERQPRGQLAGRLLRSLAVEGHHRGGHPGFPRQLGAPPVAHGRHVDLVRTPTYSFFEVVNDHLSGGPTDYAGMSGWDQTLTNQSGGRDFTPSSRPIKRREARRRCPQSGFAPIVARSRQRKICVIRLPTRFTRVIHRFSTAGLGAVNKLRASVRHVECG